MKIFINILLVFACLLIIFNITQLNFQHFFEGDSLVALIGIAASLCAVLILIIFKMSKSLDDKLNQ
jgi:hypothetical protein